MLINNRTPAVLSTGRTADSRGADCILAVASITLRLGQAHVTTEQSQHIERSDQPAEGSVSRPANLCDFKPGTEVALLGTMEAFEGSPKAREVSFMIHRGDVELLNKTLRVTGARVWEHTLTGVRPSAPAGPPSLRLG